MISMNGTKNSPGCIGIVGLGLIGGSLALDLQELGWEVHGLVHKAKSIEHAKQRGLAQVISTDPKILSPCSIVIIALPIEQILNPSEDLIKALPQSAVITDVASVKDPVMKVWGKLHPRFVGSHPMAGSEDSGINSGRKGLFLNRPWVTTTDDNTDQDSIKIVNQIARSLGCKLVNTNSYFHDQAVALVSHLPVIISASLINTVASESNPELLKLAKTLASSGFEDTTRVGGGNPSLGTAMIKYNNEAILKSLESYKEILQVLEKIVRSENWLKLIKALEKTHSLRDEFINKDN